MHKPTSLHATRIIEFSTLETKCSYLEDKRSRMAYKYIENASMELNQKLVERGWRRFGNYYSRPQCHQCELCLNLRIDVKNYKFSKSAKRTFRKAEGVSYIIQFPTLSHKHINLYNKYHLHMEQKRGWPYYDLKHQSYYDLYVNGAHNFGKEILYFYDKKLIGVDLIDFLDNGILCLEFASEVIRQSKLLQDLVNREFIFNSVAKVAMILDSDIEMFNQLKRYDVSLMLHIQPSTLSRVLNRLKNNDIIDIVRGKVIILHTKGLKQIYEGLENE